MKRPISELPAYARTPALRGRRLDFVYFGGGTPSLLSVSRLNRLFHGLKKSFPWGPTLRSANSTSSSSTSTSWSAWWERARLRSPQASKALSSWNRTASQSIKWRSRSRRPSPRRSKVGRPSPLHGTSSTSVRPGSSRDSRRRAMSCAALTRRCGTRGARISSIRELSITAPTSWGSAFQILNAVHSIHFPSILILAPVAERRTSPTGRGATQPGGRANHP